MIWGDKDPDDPDVILVAVYKRMRELKHWILEASNEMDLNRVTFCYYMAGDETPDEAVIRTMKRYAWPEIFGEGGKLALDK